TKVTGDSGVTPGCCSRRCPTETGDQQGVPAREDLVVSVRRDARVPMLEQLCARLVETPLQLGTSQAKLVGAFVERPTQMKDRPAVLEVALLLDPVHCAERLGERGIVDHATHLFGDP